MNIKKPYIKPDIEEHLIDHAINLWITSEPGPPKASGASEPTLKSSPKYDSPPLQESPFGDKPDYSDM